MLLCLETKFVHISVFLALLLEDSLRDVLLRINIHFHTMLLRRFSTLQFRIKFIIVEYRETALHDLFEMPYQLFNMSNLREFAVPVHKG